MKFVFRCLIVLVWIGFTALIVAAGPNPTIADESPHGLAPARNMTYMPHLPGLRNKTYRNHLGESKSLSEAVVLRQSAIREDRAHVPAGGLFYISETSGDAQPLRRDPFLVLGEHAYLVDLMPDRHLVHNVIVNSREKVPVADTGYRMWFDYATDHYEKPYAELALIAPSGGWPLEFPISTVFPGRNAAVDLELGEGLVAQMADFYLDREYFYGAMKMVARNIDFDRAEFESVEFPAISEVVFSMHRPIILGVRQEDYRFYFDKRIYAFRRPDGFLVQVTNFTGSKVIAEKLIKPITSQGYKTLATEKDCYHLTIPELDIRIEIMLHPGFLGNSDFMPWATGKTHGFQKGKFHFVVYRQLMTVKDGEAWPLDPNYIARLEPDMMTGMLKRLVIENARSVTFSNSEPAHNGPVKWSDIWWNRPAFKVVAKKFDDDVVGNLYLRDYYLVRTDNMIFFPEEGRENIDFFVGASPVLEPVLEDTFLTRLSDAAFGTVVEGSRFTSYPKVIADASFYEPDHTAPYVPRLKGLKRRILRNRKNERLVAAESIFIRGSYVDYRNNRIVIPPAGLNYSSRNHRNLRTLAGESFFMLGREAHLTSFSSSTFVQKNVHLDFWKNQPMGDGNLMYWQDRLLGVRNKTLRFTDFRYLDDRPVAELSLMKYSGNRWGAHFLLAQGLDPSGGNRYHLPEVFAEGATYIIPEYIGSNYVKIKEFGTPTIEEIGFTYEKPIARSLGVGESVSLGGFILECTGIDAENMTVDLVMKEEEKIVARKTIGPLNEETRSLLPQYQDAARAMQFSHGDVMAEWDIYKPFEGNKAKLHLFKEIQILTRDTPFAYDSRFMVRPDVCGHCYQVNEVLLDNPDPIILDRNNRIFDGPLREDGTPSFRIVIDHFDGEMIHAWHIEISDEDKIEKSDNLAFRPRNNVDVLVGVTGTTEGFLRLSMLPRLGFMEYWRTSAKGPHTRISGSVNTGGSAHIKR